MHCSPASQAILNGEAHVGQISYATTLTGYVQLEADWREENSQWHHLEFTLDYDGVSQTTISLYLDYTIAESVVVDGQFSEFNDICFGHDGSNYGVYDWWFDEVRISDSVLSSSQFLQYSAMPEPTTAALLIGGVAAMFVVNRRRRS